MKSLRKNKVGPISVTKQNENIMLVRESSLSFDRRHDEYVQARRAVLSSYNLVNGGSGSGDTLNLKKKMKSSLKGLCRKAGAAVQTRVGIRVYRFTVACPWSAGGQVFAFRCFLPHLIVKATKKPSLEYCMF